MEDFVDATSLAKCMYSDKPNVLRKIQIDVALCVAVDFICTFESGITKNGAYAF